MPNAYGRGNVGVQWACGPASLIKRGREANLAAGNENPDDNF